jgi:hypothetical protein
LAHPSVPIDPWSSYSTERPTYMKIISSNVDVEDDVAPVMIASWTRITYGS